jgi:hypothetical protein
LHQFHQLERRKKKGKKIRWSLYLNKNKGKGGKGTLVGQNSKIKRKWGGPCGGRTCSRSGMLHITFKHGLWDVALPMGNTFIDHTL